MPKYFMAAYDAAITKPIDAIRGAGLVSGSILVLGLWYMGEKLEPFRMLRRMK